jgi:CcmD family protein
MNISGGNAYLYAAYAVVWIVHCTYALTLVNRGKRMKREHKELNRQ